MLQTVTPFLLRMCRSVDAIRRVVLLLVLAALVPAAQAQATASSTTKRSYTIPPGDATETLRRYVDQSGEQIIYVVPVVRGVKTNEVMGEFSAREAIELMVAKTDLIVVEDPKTSALMIMRKTQSRSPPAITPTSPPDQPKASSPKQTDSSSMKTRSLLTFFAGWLAATTATHAQSNAPTASAKTLAAAEEPVVLDAFRVSTAQDTGYLATNSASATRINMVIQDTPMNIQVLTREFMNDSGTTDLNGALLKTAGISQSYGASVTARTPGDAAFTLKGLLVSLFRDGFTAYGVVDSADVERLEVVSGPASVFYGNATPGGLVNIVTKQPNPKAAGYVKLMVDERAFKRTELDYNHPLSSDGSMLGRFVFASEAGPSYRRFQHADKQFYAPSVSWQIFKNVKLSQYVEYLHDNSVLLSATPETAYGLVIYNWYKEIPWDFNLQAPNTNVMRNKITATTLLDYALTNTISGRLSFNGWSNRVAGQTIGGTYMPEPGSVAVAGAPLGTMGISPVWTKMTEAMWAVRNDWLWKVNTGPLQHKLILGLEHTYDDNYKMQWKDSTQQRYINPLLFDQLPDSTFYFPTFDNSNRGKWVIVSPNPAHGTAGTESVYLSDIVTAFNGRFNALLGDRFDRIQIRNKITNQKATTSKTSPQISGLFKATDWLGVYASYSTSMTPNTLAPDGKIYAPQQGFGSEAGLKFDTANHKIVGSVSVFSIQKKNVVQTMWVPQPDGSTSPLSIASGANRSRGWATDWVVTATDNLQFTFGYTNNVAVINVGAGGATATAPSPNQGLPASQAPRQTATAFSKYTIKSGDYKGLVFGGGVSYHDKFVSKGVQQTGFLYNSIEWINAAASVDAFVNYQFKVYGRQLAIGMRCQNIANRKYLNTDPGSAALAAPRTFSGNIELKF